MFKQRRLKFLEEEHLEILWESSPEQARREITQQYARLMTRTLVQRLRALSKKRDESGQS